MFLHDLHLNIVLLLHKCYNYGIIYVLSCEVKNMKYSNLIKMLREKLILSQTELANLLDVSFSSVNRWENGRHEPTIKVKRKIVELCELNHIEIKDKTGDK